MGTIKDAKEKVLQLVKADRNNEQLDYDIDEWDHGTERVDEVEELLDGDELYAYGCYRNYHIDYTCRALCTITEVA